MVTSLNVSNSKISPIPTLLKFLPKTLISHADRIYRLWVVFYKISQELSTIDLFGQHLLTTGLEEGVAFTVKHCDTLLLLSTPQHYSAESVVSLVSSVSPAKYFSANSRISLSISSSSKSHISPSFSLAYLGSTHGQILKSPCKTVSSSK